ncbi:hypothetical protein BDV96DRAFT_582877 [Lophiotrema nucula]|uniref:Uncharacterized protein n=1 Tax=Lophiotrema nucula TaxID=690887 RepID=A0A6A5YW65_9PLEO|nr:hypothetical protein BDV96DRAFT_582877 [Lophiotrema nucula]
MLATFLTIPAELRLKIYSYLLPSTELGLPKSSSESLRLTCHLLQDEIEHEVIKDIAAWSRSLIGTSLDLLHPGPIHAGAIPPRMAIIHDSIYTTGLHKPSELSLQIRIEGRFSKGPRIDDTLTAELLREMPSPIKTLNITFDPTETISDFQTEVQNFVYQVCRCFTDNRPCNDITRRYEWQPTTLFGGPSRVILDWSQDPSLGTPQCPRIWKYCLLDWYTQQGAYWRYVVNEAQIGVGMIVQRKKPKDLDGISEARAIFSDS